MGNKIDKKETTTFEEALIATIFQQEAVLNILERKGLLTRQEVMQELLELKKKQAQGK